MFFINGNLNQWKSYSSDLLMKELNKMNGKSTTL